GRLAGALYACRYRDTAAHRARTGRPARAQRPHRSRPRRSSIRIPLMPEAFICDGMRTPIGRYGGSLSKVRADDLAAVPIKALMARHPKADWSPLDYVY